MRREVIIPDFEIDPTFEEDGTVLIRTARKQWHCWGGHDGRRRTRCEKPITKGSTYVEFVGETPLWSGQRYHIECASQQGLLRRISE